MLVYNLYYLMLDDGKNPRSKTLYDKHWKEKVNSSDLFHSRRSRTTSTES